jgi:hypothetical protein
MSTTSVGSRQRQPRVLKMVANTGTTFQSRIVVAPITTNSITAG